MQEKKGQACGTEGRGATVGPQRSMQTQEGEEYLGGAVDASHPENKGGFRNVQELKAGAASNG